jgi:hypothetical protein
MVDWGFKWQLLAIFGGRMFNYFGQHAAWGGGPTKEIGIYRLYKGWYSKCFCGGMREALEWCYFLNFLIWQY